MKNTVVLLAAGVSIFLTLKSCVDHEISPATPSSATVESLFADINAPGYQYYRIGAILSPASASPHGTFKLRFNEEALASLDESGELPEGGNFKEGSVIVKEVYNNNILNIYAVMKKTPSDPSSGNGWLWSEYMLNGTPLYSIGGRGDACISCHNNTPNRDLVRTFDFH